MKHLAFSLTMGAGLFLASCGSKDDTGPDDTDDTEVEQVFAPSEGTYEGTNEVLEDNCDFPEDDSGAPLDETTSFSLHTVETETNTFKITLADNGGTYTCTWDDAQDFACEPLVVGSEDLSSADLDAVVISTGTVSGSLGVDTVEGTQHVDFTCEGDDCAKLADFGFNLPCSITAGYQATLQE